MRPGTCAAEVRSRSRRAVAPFLLCGLGAGMRGAARFSRPRPRGGAPAHTRMRGSPAPLRSSLLLCAAGMNVTQQLALVQRLAEVEAELQQAVQNLDGSPAARTRYQRARQAYQEVEDAVLAVLVSGNSAQRREGLRRRARRSTRHRVRLPRPLLRHLQVALARRHAAATAGTRSRAAVGAGAGEGVSAGLLQVARASGRLVPAQLSLANATAAGRSGAGTRLLRGDDGHGYTPVEPSPSSS